MSDFIDPLQTVKTSLNPWDVFTSADVNPDSFSVPEHKNGYTPEQMARIRYSFSGDDPLLCIEDERTRSNMRTVFSRDPDGERRAKKVALAYYYSMNNPGNESFIYDNIERAIEQFEGKPMSIEQAFESVRSIYGDVEEKSIWDNRLVAALGSGLLKLGDTTVNTAAFISSILAYLPARVLEDSLMSDYDYELDDRGELSEEDKTVSAKLVKEKVSQAIRGWWKDYKGGMDEQLEQNMKMPEGGWVFHSSSVSDWFINAGLSLINYAPQLEAQLALTLATGGVYALGVVYGVDGYYDIKDDENMPEISEGGAILYGIGIGAINSILEKVTLDIATGKVTNKVAKEGLKKGFVEAAKYLGFAAAKEGGEEGLEEFAENLWDIKFGRRGDTSKWTSKDWIENMFQGIPEAAFLGITTGGGLEAMNMPKQRQIAEANERTRRIIESRLDELRNKENLSELESGELTVLKYAQDCNDPELVREVAAKIVLDDVAHTVEKRNEERAGKPAEPGASEATEPTRKKDARMSEEAEEGEQETSERRARELKLKRLLPHDPQDTQLEIDKWKKKFPNIKIETVTEWSPEQVRILRERGVINPEKSATGQYDANTDTVILNISNLRPSDVPFKILHEVALHAGIRRAFGNEAANNLYRAVFDAAQHTELMQQIIDAYKLRSPLLDENGEAIYDQDGNPEYDDMTDAQKCEAAEEYLAHAAETYGVSIDEIYSDNQLEINEWGRKNGRDIHDLMDRRRLTRDWMAETGFKPDRPGWWKRLISQIRVWLAKNGFGNLRISDIETIIQKAAKAAQDGKAVRPDYAKRYAAALRREGAPNHAGETGKIVIGKIDAAPGFMEWAGLSGNGIYVDGEMLFGKHPEYFRNQIEAVSAVAFVLAAPEKANDVSGNKAFVRYDAESGRYFRIEIGNRVVGKRNQVRSVHELNQAQYEKAKAGIDSPVLQLSQTGYTEVVQPARSYSDFVKYYSTQYPNVKFSLGNLDEKINSKQFKAWFKDSKVVDEDGKPLVVYHGTNWDIMSEKPGEAVFSDKHISSGSGDYGFFGRGFYFTFGNGEASEAEAGYYGKKVYPFYLSIQNPFYFLESLRSWNGSRVFDDDVGNSVELLNAAKLFPELLSDIKLYTYDKKADFAEENDSVGEISIPEYADMFNKVYREKKFEFRKDAEQNELVIEADPVEHSENGETWTEYGFSVRTAIPKGDTDLRLIATHYYLEQGNDVTVDVSDNVLHDFYGEKEFRAWLEKEGYDGVMQSKDGDEVVAFRPEQIKSATENVGTFDQNNPDVRYSVSPVWTGSAADYEQPDLNFVGTGEGAQVYGWGLYGSEDEDVGRWYARADVRRKGNDFPSWQYAHDAVRAAVTMKGGRVLDDIYVFNSTAEKTDLEYAWEDIVYELENYLADKINTDFGGTISAELLRKVAIDKIQWRINAWQEGPTFEQYKKDLSYLLDEDKKGELEFRDIEIEQDKGRNLYKQTFWADKQEDLLDWDEPLSKGQIDKILAEMDRDSRFEKQDYEKEKKERGYYTDIYPDTYEFSHYNEDDGTLDYKTIISRHYLEQLATSSIVYHDFEDLLGSAKEASEFLYRAGIDGVTYIGHESGARNYVAFSDKDIRVDDHIRFSVDSDEFRNWFKDSKVVDENGKPLVVYHDTNAKIYVNKETGENWDDLDWKAREEWEDRDDWDQHWIEQDFYTFSRVRARRSVEYPGFFFSPSPDPNHEYGERRIAAYLSIQNPAINPKIEDAGVYDDSGEKAMKKLIEQGYDGIIRMDDEGNVEEYIAFYPEQIKSVDNAGTFDPNNPDIRYSVSPVWTGSAADYEKPDLNYVGTGEGAQVYGWGLYGSKRRNVAEWYAKQDARRKSRPILTFRGKDISGSVDAEVVGYEAFGDSEEGKRKRRALKRISGFVSDFPEDSLNIQAARAKEFPGSPEDHGGIWEKAVDEVVKDLKLSQQKAKRNLYKQTFWPDKEENLIDWFDRVSDDQLQQIADEAVKENIEPYRLAYTKDGMNYPNISGEGYFVYRQIINALGSPKAASEFLYRAGIDGMTYIGGSSGVRNFVAFSDKDIRVDDHIRFSLLDVDGNEDVRAYIDIIKPYVPWTAKEKSGEFYAGILKEKAGVEISPESAMQIAEEAERERRKANIKKSWDEAYSYFSSANPLFDYVVNNEMVETIRPSHRFEGEDFSGSFISPEFVRYSEKKQRSKYKTDRGWTNYLRRRDDAFAKATGAHSDELAKGYVLEHGGDELEVEQQIIDLFRDLKRTDIRKAYAQFKRDNFARDIMEQHQYEEMMEEEFQRELDDKVISVLSAGQPVVTDDWVTENRDVYKELYKRIIGKEAPYTPSKRDIEAINAALVQEGSDAATYAKAYKDARAASAKEAMEQISDLRRRVVEGKENAMKLQREAAALLKRFGLEGDRRFSGRIIELMKYQTEARRQKAFDKLMEDILLAGTAQKQMRLYERMQERLQQLGRRADTGRRAVGVRDEATQIQIDKIREIAQMSPYEISVRQGELQDAINAATENGDSTVAFEEELALLGKYGDLVNKTPAELTLALADLNDLAMTGKRRILERLQERAKEDVVRRTEAIELINGGNFASMSELDRLENKRNAEAGTLKNNALFDLFSGFNLWGKLTALNLASKKEIRDTVFYQIMELTHESARNQDTLNEKHQKETLEAIDKFFGTKGAFERAAKMNALRKVEQKTGVFRRHIDETKGMKWRKMSIDEARELLKDYDLASKEGRRTSLKDYEAEAIRHQLLVYDRKLDKAAPEYLDSVTEKILKQIEEAKEKGEKKVFIPEPQLTDKVELELSQMQALYQYMMWQQKNTRYKMIYNGWDEESVAQLEAFLRPEVKRFGDWMKAQLEADRKDIDPVYERLYMTAFPHVEQYFPAVYHHRGQNSKLGSSGGVDLNQAGAGAQPMAFSPGALKQRVFHVSELRNVDALHVFQNHRMIMTHFVTHGEAARTLRALFANKDVKQAILERLGSKQYSSLTEDIQDFINGGHIQEEKGALLRPFYSAAVRSKMMINVTSGAKQVLGALTYMQDIPAKEFVSGVSYAMAHPKEVWETLGKTDYFKNRWQQGSNRDLRMLLDSSGRNTGFMDVIMEKADTLSSLPLRMGDAGAVLFGGYAVYRYQYQQGIKRGLSEADAKARALLEWEMSTERTQQSGQVHMMNKLQKGSTFDRIMTTYLSNQILMWNHYAPRFFKGDFKGGARGMLAAAITSVAMTTMNQLFRNGIWLDDWQFWDYFWDYLSDVLNGSGGAGVYLGRAIEGAHTFGRGSDVLQSDTTRAFRATGKIGSDVLDEDYEKAMKDALDILTFAGYFYQPLTPVLSGVREVRKLKKTVDAFDHEDE